MKCQFKNCTSEAKTFYKGKELCKLHYFLFTRNISQYEKIAGGYPDLKKLSESTKLNKEEKQNG